MGDKKVEMNENEEAGNKIDETIASQLKNQFQDKFEVDIDWIEEAYNSNNKDKMDEVVIEEMEMKKLMHELNVDPMTKVPLLLFFELRVKTFYEFSGRELYQLLGPLFDYPKNIHELSESLDLIQYNVEYNDEKMEAFNKFWKRIFQPTYERMKNRLHSDSDSSDPEEEPKAIDFFIFQYKKHYDAIKAENEERLAIIEEARTRRIKQLEEQEGSAPLADAFRARVARNESKAKARQEKEDEMKLEANQFKTQFLNDRQKEIERSKNGLLKQNEDDEEENDENGPKWSSVHRLCTQERVEKHRRRFQKLLLSLKQES